MQDILEIATGQKLRYVTYVMGVVAGLTEKLKNKESKPKQQYNEISGGQAETEERLVILSGQSLISE